MNIKTIILVFAVMAIIMAMPACKLFEDDNPKLENHATITGMQVRYVAERDGAMLYVKDIMAKYVNNTAGYVAGILKIDWVSGKCPFGRYYEAGIDLPSTHGEEIEGLLDLPGAERFAYFEFKGEKTETIPFTVEFMGKTTTYQLQVTMRSL